MAYQINAGTYCVYYLEIMVFYNYFALYRLDRLDPRVYINYYSNATVLKWACIHIYTLSRTSAAAFRTNFNYLTRYNIVYYKYIIYIDV